MRRSATLSVFVIAVAFLVCNGAVRAQDVPAGNPDDMLQVSPRGPEVVNGPAGSTVLYTVINSNGSTSGNGRAPQGSRLFVNTKYLISGAEMVASGFPNSPVTSIGWRWNMPRPGAAAAPVAQSVATTGNLKVFLKDTAASATALIGTFIDTNGVGYTKIIDATISITRTDTLEFFVDVPVGGPGTAPFTPTPGNGVLVIFCYQTTTPLATPLGAPTVACLNNGALLTYQSQTANGTTGTASAFRPHTRFGAAAPVFILPANPGPPNNGGSAGWAIFFDLIAGSRNIDVTHMRTGSTAAAAASYSVEVFTRAGTALGGPVGSGPGSSTAGWTLLDTVPVVQGPTASGISEVFALPTIAVGAGDTVGVALRFIGAGPRYFGTGTPPYSVYADTNLTLVTGDGRSTPFTTTGTWFASRALTGEIHYSVGTTDVKNTGAGIPDGFRLSQNYPNPFNPSTTIEFAIPQASNVALTIYNTLGQEIASLVDGEYPAGSYRTTWNAAGYASGIYFYRLQAGSFTQTMKLILLK